MSTPLRLSLDLAEPPSIVVTVTVRRRDLPKQAEDCIKWATIITGALNWSLKFPPSIRRNQFIINLVKPCTTWVSPGAAKKLRAIRKKAKNDVPMVEAQSVTFSSNKSQCENAIALLLASKLALYAKLPAKITVSLDSKRSQLPLVNPETVLAGFASRLTAMLVLACQHAKNQPGGATQDRPLTFWVGAAAAVANRLIMDELADKREASPELQTIINEASKIKGFHSIQRQHDRRRFYTLFIVTRALEGIPSLRRLSALAPLMRSTLDPDNVVSQIESFHYTYVQPNAKKLRSNPALAEVLTTHLRPLLLGKPGALTQDLSLPKNAF